MSGEGFGGRGFYYMTFTKEELVTILESIQRSGMDEKEVDDVKRKIRQELSKEEVPSIVDIM